MHILSTQRLILGQADKTDAPFFLRLLNSPTWIQFIGDRGVRTLEDAAGYIQKSLINSYREHGYGLYKMTLIAEEKPIGICGFVKRAYLDHADIGFALLPAYEGKGYTYEAAEALLAYGENVLKLEKVLAVTTAENIKSRKLLFKLGLVEQGTIFSKGVQEEFLLFST